MMTMVARKAPLGAVLRSIRIPMTGPPMAAAAVNVATTYDPVAAVPPAAMTPMMIAGPTALVEARASVAVVR